MASFRIIGASISSTQSPWLVETVQRANIALRHESFVVKIATLIETVLTETGAIPHPQITKEALLAHAKLIHNIEAKVEVGGTSNITDLAQATPAYGLISLQGGWVVQAERSKHIDMAEYKRHVTLGVIKLLHEYAHLLTPAILSYDFDIRYKKGRTAVMLKATPPKIGFNFSHNGTTNKGDMGFLLEELLSGALRARYYPQFDDEVAYGLLSINMVQYSSTSKRFRTIAIDVDALADKVTSVLVNDPECYDFTVVTLQEPSINVGAKRDLDEAFTVTKSLESFHDEEESPYQWQPYKFSEKYGVVEEGTSLLGTKA